MDLESFGYVVKPNSGADQQKEQQNADIDQVDPALQDPETEPEIDLDEERDPEDPWGEDSEILQEEQEIGVGSDEVAAEPEILVDKRVNENDIEIVGEVKELGRPSKLDENTIKRLNTALKIGLSQKKSALFSGISETTFYRWQRRFNDIDEACGGDPDNIKNAEDLELWEFWQSLKKAKVEGEINHLGVITKAAENGVWQASAWFMERSNPEEWGKRDKNQLEDGKDEEVIKVEIRYSS